MRPIILAVALILCFSGAIARDAPVRVTWENTTLWHYYPGAEWHPILFAIGQNGCTYQGSTYMRYVPGQSIDPSMYLRALDTDGSLLWDYHYIVTESAFEDMSVGLAVDPWGNVILTGRNYGDWVTIKYAENGEVLWIRRLEGGGSAWPYDMVIDRSGNIAIGGFIGETHATPATPYLVKYSPAGDTLWSANVPIVANASGRIERVAVDGQDNVYTGTAQVQGVGSRTQWDVLIDKYSPDGALLWRRERPREDRRSDYLRAFWVDSSGNVYVRGAAFDFWTYLYNWFQKYSPEGELLWSQEFTRASLNANVLAHDETRQKLYVLGTVDGATLTLMQVDAITGEWGWRAQVPVPPSPNRAIGGIVIDSHGNLIVLGRTIKGRRYWAEDIRFTLTKFTPDGRELWTYVHPTDWWDPGPWSLKIDAEDNIYVWGIEVAKLQMLPVRCEGDLDYDGVVDDTDLMAVLANQGANTFEGDVNEDGVVDFTDFEIVMEHYGMGVKE